MVIKYKIKCEVCGKEVIKSRAEWQVPPKFCSNECKFKGQVGQTRGRKKNVVFDCLQCGKHVETYRGPKSIERYGYPKFCNKKCLDAYQVGTNNPNYRNGVRQCKGGYIELWIPNHPAANGHGCVPEHRVVVEKHIGRFLTDEEVVHHIDGDRSNNDISNLVLCANQSEHSKYHRKGGRYYEPPG